MSIAEVPESSRPEPPKWARAVAVLVLLYLFLAGVSALSEGIESMGSGFQEGLFSSVSNPLAGLFVGILATVLVQSSSVTTSTVVGLVGTGLLGVNDAIPVIMGANIGTTVTNTLVSLAHVRHSQEFRRALASATVHDFFNVIAVAILLPVELTTRVLSRSAEALTRVLVGSGGTTYKSPIKEAVKTPVKWVTDLYEALGLSGNVLGTVLVITGLVAILAALAFITGNMRKLVADRVERSVNAVLSQGGGIVAMVIGLIITVAVQSSSITTSMLIPVAASGAITLENVYPVTLGANVGTTVTALLASLATGRPEALTVALVHTIFNLSGIVILYPFPPVRKIPLRLARGLADLAVQRRSVAVAYVVGAFIVVPALGVAVLR
ncbi:MAG TPA: sodium dependent phosphate transporter [Acidimicrobiales bacterium]|nr:sodium dependent phosphate transporter [Acidimicrobiales bacterium]